MPGFDRITIIGMGPIGASIGLGLKRAGLERTEVVGTDRDRRALSAASGMGAVDRTSGNLGSALDGAQMVIIDASLAETKDLLEAIGPVLADGCVVTDTGIAKMQVMDWAKSYLPPRASFVAGRPLLKQSVTGLDDARAALFDDTDYCIIPAESADSESVRSVVGMVQALGARPLFLDAQEHDSFAAAVAHLPALLSSALVGATGASASWREISLLAGPEFRDMSRLAAMDPEDRAAACLAVPDALVYWIDQAIAELRSYRDMIEKGGDGLLEALVRSWEERAKWEAGVVVEEDGTDIPSAAQSMSSMVIGRRLTARYQQLKGAGKGAPWKYRKRS